jgi:uncharacterized membrane protein YdjX (TVP38/TMEM64 family)
MSKSKDKLIRLFPSLAGRPGRTVTMLKGIVLAGLVIGLLLVARRIPLASRLVSLESWIRGLGVWGPLVYGLIYVAAVVALAPASALTVAAGVLFGPVVGTVTASLASTTGAALAFLIARYLARDAVARKLGADPRFAAIDRAIARSGWIIVALLRLSPAVPFNLQNYLYGLTAIGFWTCVLTSGIAMLPGTVMYVYLGYIGRAGIEAATGGAGRARTPVEWAFLIIGLGATVAVTIFVTWLARRAMQAQTPLSDVPASDENPARNSP